ncbi:protein TRI1-like [Ctenocephalides felis]|uniref:protein TRI1-like n=1 Tax=Ctenocephalides felis TaxID=7515 RepID=UPI000E6E4F19|nr:protein TRI1-like [Ctenocephalides felis]
MVPKRHRKGAKLRKHRSTLSDILFNKKKQTRAASNVGIHRRYFLSESLAKLIGSSEPQTRYNVIKLVWDQIKKRQLQDPDDPAYILSDDEFEAVTGMARFKGFTVIKHLGPHFLG